MKRLMTVYNRLDDWFPASPDKLAHRQFVAHFTQLDLKTAAEIANPLARRVLKLFTDAFEKSLESRVEARQR